MSTFAKIKVSLPYLLTLPTTGPLIGGERNPFYDLILFLNDSVPNNKRYTYDGITYTYDAEVLLEMFDLTIAGLIVQQGGNVFNLPLFFQVDLAAPVHERLHDEALETQPTWGEWFDSQTHHKPIRKESGYFIGTNVFEGDYLSVAEALLLGVQLSTLPEFRALPDYVDPVENPEEGEGV